jgi:hypothetical protein
MTSVTDAQYERAAQACLHACRKWQAEHPGARLRFQPIPLDPRALAIGSLESALARGVAGNSATRRLLTALSRAVRDGGGTTILMAEYALEMVYGLRRPLTQPGPS